MTGETKDEAKLMGRRGKNTANPPKQRSSKDIAESDDLSSIPRFKPLKEGAWAFCIESDEQAQTLFGNGSMEFATALAAHCGNVSGTRDAYELDRNYALALVAEIAPQDGIEAMLATQMAAVHVAMMRHSSKLANADTLQQLDSYERIFNKLARTFTSQMEALRKHRHGGQQKMTVEHVTVNDGGQAIVGHLTRGGAAK
ncbi:hypothetical protein [uncultured Roseovarius sp.]|uniref:hypothetical protein n=1 Tax=uncultured Roseovarius sp. TaxID=293344 RepID=UPI00260C787F|nr:hypothetical protein [uncultured Roseovarius sp.]